MFQITTAHLQRQLKTSEPRFKRLNRLASRQNDKADLNQTVHSNFPLVNRGIGLDNSKQNLCYETHLMKVRSACKLDETAIVSAYLNSIRKDFDGMSKNSRLQLASIKLKRRQIQLMKMKNKEFTRQREQFEQKIIQKQKQASAIKNFYEDSKMQTKTLENIIYRMKKDEIFYKQFGRIRDEEVKKKVKELKFLEQNIIQEDGKLQKLINILSKCKSYYNKNQDLRQKKFQDFAGKISDVQQRDKFIEERKERTYQLQSIELNDTLDQKNIHMREIILVHKIADSLLQSKVSTLIKKYADVQNAFHLVKLKTCVNEPQLLASKFFSYEQTSESLLESINQNQRKIDELSRKKAKLTEKYQEIITQNLSISDSKHSSKFDSMSLKMYNLIQGINDEHLLKDQIQTWIQKKMGQFHLAGDINTTFQGKFKNLCHYLCENIKKYQTIGLESKKPIIMSSKMKKQIKQRSGIEASILLRQSDEPSQSNLIQQQYIRLARQNAIKKGFSIKSLKRDPVVGNK